MSAAGDDEQRQALWDEVGRLTPGNWRAVIQRQESGKRAVVGSDGLVRLGAALLLVARGRQLQAQGYVQRPWRLLSDAAALLPSGLTRRDRLTGTVLALLPSPGD